MARRTVKAWAVVCEDGTYLKEFAVRLMARMSASRYPGCRVVPCTITYDDGRPAKPRARDARRRKGGSQ